MPDNIPPPTSGPLPPLPSSGRTGRLPSPTTHLPVKKGGAGKIVVMLSSVAKPPPAVTQPLSPGAPSSSSPPKATPPPLAPKQVLPESPPPQPRSATTNVKLPPKTTVPPWSSLSGPLGGKAAPPPLPAKPPEPKKPGAQHIPPIKLNELSSPTDASGESIFPKAGQPEPASKPEGWKSLEPGEVNRPAGSLQSLEVFERSQSGEGKPTSLPEAKDKTGSLVAPPLRPPTRVETPGILPPPVVKTEETSSRHVAPPLLEKTPEPLPEKLPQPHRPDDARKGEAPRDSSEAPAVQKVPALIQPEAPAKPSSPPASPVAKTPGNWMKKTTPLVVSSSSPKGQPPKITETKPALKPAVLPRRSLLVPEALPPEPSPPPVKTPKITQTTEKSDTPPPAALAAQPPVIKTPSSWEKEKPAPAALSAQPPAAVPVSPKAKAPLPPTRAERAKKRHLRETVIFYTLFVVTVFALFFASLHFGRDTRVEGQIIPPQGMTLNNEVWIVTDFGSLATGTADDLAKERAPLMQEIQERQDHVQRAQADVAAREERIRLIQGGIDAAKQEIMAVSKQARDATQEIWDVDGAEIDTEYQARFDQLKQEIADRAKSLNLKYEPDETYQSPEVWANAYRLALYDVPAGVDTVKEHQWLGDEMKQWRDFLKTLDDRKEQLREKAALIKTSTGPKAADLNAKIDNLQQRIDATTTEEAPLKAELEQAQTELEDAQTTEAGLDDKYYKQLDSLPEASITKHISMKTNGRFTWVDDDPFVEGEKNHRYWIFTRAIRSDGRQYWALHPFSISQNKPIEMYIEPGGFVSTKAILRPDLSPEEQEQ